MSEYQYYDFYSIDRSLSKDELERIRTYSSRVNPSSRRATFAYNYSDFRYDEEEVLNDFFDMMLYVTNWGSRRLLMKFPAKLVSYKALKEYEIDASYDYEEGIRVFKKGSNVLIDLDQTIEGGDWIEGEGMLDDLLPVRAQILNGDYRVLYLGWLHLVSENPEIPEDYSEPPVPANLQQLDDSLESFAYLWEIDWDLIQTASERSEVVESLSDEALASQIAKLSHREKDQFLQELIRNEVKAKHELRKRLRELHIGPEESTTQSRRTLAELMARRAEVYQEQLEKQKLAAEQAHRKKMARIEQEEPNMWKEVYENAELKKAKGYERATEILKELKEYYEYTKNQAAFDDKMGDVLDKFGRLTSFKRRLQANGIL